MKTKSSQNVPYIFIIAIVAIVAVVLLVLNYSNKNLVGEALSYTIANDYVSLKKLNNAMVYTEYIGDSPAKSCNELCSLRGSKTCVDSYLGVNQLITGSTVQIWYPTKCSTSVATTPMDAITCRCY